MWHEGLEFGVPLPRGRRLDLVSKGWVGLDDQSLDLEIALPIPDDMPLDRPVLAALGGKRLSIGIGGKLGDLSNAAETLNYNRGTNSKQKDKALAEAVEAAS